MLRQVYCVLFGLTLSLVLAGCSSGTTSKETSIKSRKNVTSSAAELSSRNQSLLALYSAEIESAADQIMAKSSSPPVRRQALVWKAEAIPAMQTSLLRTDPLAALVDSWAFIAQMKAYMAQPDVKQGWGDSYPVVEETLNRMQGQMGQLVKHAAPAADMPVLQQKIDAWAQAHPIQVSLSGRESADTDLVRNLEQSALGARASLNAIVESIGDLTARLDTYNAYLPKQARWQVELMISDLASSPQAGAAMASAASLTGTLAKTSDTLEHAPELVREMQKTTMADVEAQRLAGQAFLQGERKAVLDAVDRERMATVAGLRGERLAATADLRGERQIILDSLQQQEAKMMSDLDGARERALVDFDNRSRGLIDHFFLRALELTIFMAVLSILAVWLFLRGFLRRRQRGEDFYTRAA